MSAETAGPAESAMQGKNPRLPVSRELRDGYEVHRAALARGLSITLLPRQVLELQTADGESKSTFVHGVPQGSKLSSVTYVQDLRMRRALLSRAGFKVPLGATFSVGRSSGSAHRYAQRIRYPVVVKPAVGDNTVEVVRDIRNRRSLQKAIEYLHTPPSERPQNTRASYALTELREPGEQDGKIIVPPGYRFLVEKQHRGQYLRLLVLNGELISALHCYGGPWNDDPDRRPEDILAVLHPSIGKTAQEAAAAIQGIALAAIDVVVPDYSRYTEVTQVNIVEYSERPWLQVQHNSDPELAAALGDTILSAGFGTDALSAPQDSLGVQFRIDGSVDPGGLLPVLREECQWLGITVEAEVTDPVMGHIEGTMHGPPGDIAWVYETVLDDAGLHGQRGMLVETRNQ